jgi:hypothetical protein
VSEPDQTKLIAEFECYIPQIKSAMLFGADGAQVKLEIPGTDIAEALKLAAYGQNQVLRVQVYSACRKPTP